MFYASGNGCTLRCQNDVPFRQLLSPLESTNSARKLNMDSIPAKFMSEETKFKVRFFGLTLWSDDCMRIVLVVESTASQNQWRELSMFLVDDFTNSAQVELNLTGSIRISSSSNASLGSHITVNGKVAIIPGRNKVLLLDFENETAKLLKLPINDDEEKVLPIVHGRQLLILKQSNDFIKIFGIKNIEIVNFDPKIAIGTEFAGHIAGVFFPFCSLTCKNFTSDLKTIICTMLVLTKNGRAIKLNSKGVCLESSNLVIGDLNITNFSFLPSANVDFLCFLDNNGNLYWLNLETLKIDLVIENVQNFFVGNYFQRFYLQVLTVRKTGELTLVDGTRQTKFEFYFKPISERNDENLSSQKLVSKTIINRAENLQILLQNLRIKNLSIVSYIQSACLKFHENSQWGNFLNCDTTNCLEMEAFGNEENIVGLLRLANFPEKLTEDLKGSCAWLNLVPSSNSRNTISDCFKVKFQTDSENGFALISFALKNLEDFISYEFFVIVTRISSIENESFKSVVVGKVYLNCEDLSNLKSAPEIKMQNVSILQLLRITFDIHVSDCFLDFDKLFQSFVAKNQIEELDVTPSKKLFRFTCEVLCSCFFVAYDLSSFDTTFNVTVKTSLQKDIICRLFNEQFAKFCSLELK